jgi:hypothetical protein
VEDLSPFNLDKIASASFRRLWNKGQGSFAVRQNLIGPPGRAEGVAKCNKESLFLQLAKLFVAASYGTPCSQREPLGQIG